VLEVLAGVKRPAQACREYGLKDSVLSRWKQQFLQRAPQVFEPGAAHDPCRARIAELERLLGQLTLELELELEVVGLARSSFYYQEQANEERELRGAIEAVIQEFPTYGSRRVTAQLRRDGWSVNRKRIQRLMCQMELKRPRKKRGCRTTQSRHPFPIRGIRT
jgi:putative transposase